MKNSNRNTLIFFITLILLLCTLAGCGGDKKKNETETETESLSENILPETTENIPVVAETEKKASGFLFIGDSRTVGLSEYAGIKTADFFANTGMSVYNVRDKKISVPSAGKVTLETLLDNRQYGSIYIMLGINEAGYDKNQTVKKYGELLSFIEEKQPDADIFIGANLHVTKERSLGDNVINNAAIDTINNGIKAYADGRKIFYIDSNPLFDDGNGNLAEDKTADSAHLFAKYYSQWGSYIISRTEELKQERNLEP